MNSLTSEQIQKMRDDIAVIKSVLAKTRPSLQLLFLPVHFRIQSLFAGISIIAIAGAYQVLMQMYGHYQAIPELYRYLMLGVILLDLAFLSALKLANWSRSLAGMDARYSFRRAAMEIMSFRTRHAYLVFLLSMVFFIAYFIITEQYYFIIPAVSIGSGIMLNIIGSFTEIAHYIIAGLWMLLAGFAIIALGTVPATIAISASMGIGCIIFAAHAWLSDPRGTELSEG